MLSKQDQNVPMSQQLQQNAQGYLQQGMQPSTASPLTQPQVDAQGNPVPVTQQSFSGVTPMSGDIPQYTGGQQYVPGLGYLGADLGGAVQGTMLRQQYAMNAAQNNRDEETIGIAKTKLAQDQDYLNIAKTTTGMKLNQASMDTMGFERQQALQQGMTQAANEGGFSAVFDYLKNADPAMAMQFGSLKANLDKSIMENDTYKFAHQWDKQQAMMGGYQMLGTLGATLLNAPPEQRGALWEQMQPIAKQIDPSISKKLDDSVIAKLGLGMSLSTPASILYNGAKSAIEYQSTAGKIMGDLNKAQSKYGVDSPQAKLLAAALNNNQAMNEKNQLQIASTIAQNQQSGESGLRQQWLGESKAFNQLALSNSAVQKSSTSAKLPNGEIKGPDDMAVIYNYYKMLDPTSVIMPGEYANAENTRGWNEQMRKQYNSVVDPAGAKLTNAQRTAFATSAQQLYDTKMQSYNSLKIQFRDIAQRNNYNPDNITIDQVNAQLPQPTPQAVDLLMKDPNPTAQKQFQYVFGQDALNKVMSKVQPQQGMQPVQQPGVMNGQQ